MNKLKSHFKFSKQEQSGIFFLLLIIAVLQVVIFVLGNTSGKSLNENFKVDLNTQTKIDSLKKKELEKDSIRLFPFNPNYITDYKGYVLGMTMEEIDKLHSYRRQNKFVNSAKEFQEVTQISDSLLQLISPYFKFPEWTKKKKPSKLYKGIDNVNSIRESNEIMDLNKATAQELKTINGIGDKLSARIIKFRDRLGGFLIDDQLNDVYGLEVEVVQRTLLKFKVLKKPIVQKININEASSEEIAKLVYIQKHVAEAIVDYRNINGAVGSFDELAIIKDFPKDKIERLALYLQL